VDTTCPLCQGPAAVTDLDSQATEKWLAGAQVQDVFRDLSADEREILITGTHGSCWDAAFPDE
jgi:hypothetical protein